jgi:hypothetical protein
MRPTKLKAGLCFISSFAGHAKLNHSACSVGGHQVTLTNDEPPFPAYD